MTDDEEPDDEDSLTWDQVFVWCGKCSRANYRKQWQGDNYYITSGRFKGKYLTDITRETWLEWALNTFSETLPYALYRALVDQINSLHL